MSQPIGTCILSEALARLDKLTNWERRPRDNMREGLSPMRDLMRRLGSPQHSFRAVHVTGTKGKGSVCALIEAALLRAGRRVGRYSSPHVQTPAERINIHGHIADEAAMASALLRTLAARENAARENSAAQHATWFDVMTACAFLMFKDNAIEWAIVEVGLGGRRDSTNVVCAEIAIVTNVELEHTEILGDSREAIAQEKVGILKSNAVLVTPLPASDPAGRILQEYADRLGCPVLRTPWNRERTIEENNSALAGAALGHLGRKGEITDSAGAKQRLIGSWLLDRATKLRARLPGRMERFDIEISAGARERFPMVPVIFDGAHVPFNLKAVLGDLSRQPDLQGPCVSVVAIAKDKDASGFLATLSSRARVIICTELAQPSRSHSALDLSACAASLNADNESEPDSSRAFKRSLELASNNGGWVLVTGSLYLVGDLRASVARTEELEHTKRLQALECSTGQIAPSPKKRSSIWSAPSSSNTSSARSLQPPDSEGSGASTKA